MEKISRLSVDIPAKMHQHIKAMAALSDMSVRDMVIATFQEKLEMPRPKKLKPATAKAMADARKGKNVKGPFHSLDALFKDLNA